MNVLTIIVAILILLVIFGSKKYIVDRLWYGRRLPPGPTPMPIIGTLYAMTASPKPWINFSEIAKRYGPISLNYFGQMRMVMLAKPSIIRECYVANSKQFSDRASMFVPGMKSQRMGIVFESGEPWARRRRFLMRSMRDFGVGKMQNIEPVHSEVEQLIDNFQKFEGQPLNPRQLIGTSIANVICSIVFGKRYPYDAPEFRRLINAMDKLTRTHLLLGVLHYMFPLLERICDNINTARINRVYDLVDDMLKTCLVEHQQDFNAEHIRHFPDLFIQSEREATSANGAAESNSIAITYKEFRTMMGDMFLAGSETTSTSLQWSLFCLAKWPEIQRKCQETIDASMGGSNRLPTLDDRNDLVYLEAVFHEVLRYVTIAPLGVPHGVWSDEKIGDYVIPERSVVFYNIWALHHDKEYWGNPEKFDPSRWIGEDGKLCSHSTHFMPFGLGPRICLGESLARVEYFTFIVALLQRFSVSFPGHTNPVDMDSGTNGFVHLPPHFEIVLKSR